MTSLAFLAGTAACAAMLISARPYQTAEPAAPQTPVATTRTPEAFITSRDVFYAANAKIELTFSVHTGDTSVIPRFKIVHRDGETAAPKQVNGKYFWESSGKSIEAEERHGAIPAKQNHTETIADLGQWYTFDAIGMYTIRFDGEWVDDEHQCQSVMSNELRIWVTGPSGEIEPGGEPIQMRAIPLADIWALRMPGTQPMEMAFGAGPDGNRDIAPEGTMVREILQSINKHEWPRRNAPPGFAVSGTEMKALREAHAVLVNGKQPAGQFRPGERVSLVFFSRNYERRIHLDHVEHFNSAVHIYYKTYTTWPAGEALDTSHIALIPMTVPEEPELRAEIRPLIDWASKAPPPPTLESLSRSVCDSFVFGINR